MCRFQISFFLESEIVIKLKLSPINAIQPIELVTIEETSNVNLSRNIPENCIPLLSRIWKNLLLGTFVKDMELFISVMIFIIFVKEKIFL